jgi:sulfite reductase beta subunit-like hemoprotein
MDPHQTVDAAVADALATVSDFIRQVTGVEPTPAEIADALTRYFVMKEIKDHIVMLREGEIDS